MYVCMYVHVCMYVTMYVCNYVTMYVCIYAFMYMYICILCTYQFVDSVSYIETTNLISIHSFEQYTPRQGHLSNQDLGDI